jgi:hypothetical protein
VTALEIVKMQLQLLEFIGYIWVQAVSISISNRLRSHTPWSSFRILSTYIASIMKKKALKSDKEHLEHRYLSWWSISSNRTPSHFGDHFVINHASATSRIFLMGGEIICCPDLDA